MELKLIIRPIFIKALAKRPSLSKEWKPAVRLTFMKVPLIRGRRAC